jgi:uncharacterized protein (DUF983 family)
MKIRTCPNCNHKHSFRFNLKNSSMYGTKWNCTKCATLLTYDWNRRFLLVLISVIPFLIFGDSFFVKVRSILEQFSISLWPTYLLMIALFIIWCLIITSFENYVLLESKEKKAAISHQR